MDNPDKIPEDKIKKPEKSTGSPVDENDPLVTEPGVQPIVELRFGDGEQISESPIVEYIEPKVTENIDFIQVWYKDPVTGDLVPVGDKDGDGVPDVRSCTRLLTLDPALMLFFSYKIMK